MPSCQGLESYAAAAALVPVTVRLRTTHHPKRIERASEYLETEELNVIFGLASNPKAKILLLEQWRAGLCVSDALEFEVRDLPLDSPHSTIRIRSGK